MNVQYILVVLNSVLFRGVLVSSSYPQGSCLGFCLDTEATSTLAPSGGTKGNDGTKGTYGTDFLLLGFHCTSLPISLKTFFR